MIERDEARLVLRGDHRGPAVPTKHAELAREVFIEPGARVDGAVLGGRVHVAGPNTVVTGPVYARRSMSIKPAGGRLLLSGGVISRDAILVENGPGEKGWTTIVGDVHSDRVRLERTIVFGAVFGRTVNLQNCAVLGGVYGRDTLTASSTLLSTFHARTCELNEHCYLLFLGGTAIREMIVRRPVTCLQFMGWDWLFAQAPTPQGGAVQLTQDDVEGMEALEDGKPTTISVLGAARRILATEAWESVLGDNRLRLTRLLARRHLPKEEREALPPLSQVEASLARVVFAKGARPA